MRSTTKLIFPWCTPATPYSSEPGSLWHGLFPLEPCLSHLHFSSAVQVFGCQIMILSFLSTWLRYICHRFGTTQQKGPQRAGAYLHANDRIDEEQHGYEKGDIWEGLEGKKRLAQHWSLVSVTARAD